MLNEGFRSEACPFRSGGHLVLCYLQNTRFLALQSQNSE